MGEDSKPRDEKSQNLPIKSEAENDLEEEDFDFFIKDLQRIIDESPPAPGMQSQFARTISYLKEKKNTLKALGKLMVNEDKQEIYRKVLKLVDGEIETVVYSEERFQNVLQLVKMREELSERKAAETPKMPEKVFPKTNMINSPAVNTLPNLIDSEKKSISDASSVSAPNSAMNTLAEIKEETSSKDELIQEKKIPVENIKDEIISSNNTCSIEITDSVEISDPIEVVSPVEISCPVESSDDFEELTSSKRNEHNDLSESSIDNAIDIGHE